ncbi:hypothetical protein FA13DRAFT_1731996 [Coprinellus micaceus]|uniref:Uncharacterized protein n=1 Tax=Coprinellus micaceus TaxID=71717 RepID=A0A4Y7TFA8_COPMI|nr:hypothetical protein FA13DRAFT_1731996 [Coprinellus micaceus]
MADWDCTSQSSDLPPSPFPHPQPTIAGWDCSSHFSGLPPPHPQSTMLDWDCASRSYGMPPFPSLHPQSTLADWTFPPVSSGLRPSELQPWVTPSPKPDSRKKKKGTNKKPPRAYPLELQTLIEEGYIIWGQNIPGIRPFNPSRGVGQAPHFSSYRVTQTQAGAHDLRTPPTSRMVAPPTPNWDSPRPPSNPYGRDGSISVNWNLSPRLEVPQRPSYIVQSSPLLSEAGSMDSNFSHGDCYADDPIIEPSPPRASTSFLHHTAAPEAGPSAHVDTMAYPLHFRVGNTVAFSYPSVTAAVLAPQQTSMDGMTFGGQAPLHHPRASRGHFASASDPSPPFFAN